MDARFGLAHATRSSHAPYLTTKDSKDGVIC